MFLNGEAYSERLETLSTPTLRLLSEVQSLSREAMHKTHEITSDSELTEEEIVRRLQDLKNMYSEKTDK